ncbi:MAG: BREX protein BrxB domain-containing protein, partial [Muribaculaceae bacterium]
QFYEYINRRIMEHVNAESTGKKPYVFLYGIGSMFPFLRTSVFLSGYEEFNETSNYKIIVFYPGESEGNSFSLFGKINDQHTYRAILLLND